MPGCAIVTKVLPRAAPPTYNLLGAKVNKPIIFLNVLRFT